MLITDMTDIWESNKFISYSFSKYMYFYYNFDSLYQIPTRKVGSGVLNKAINLFIFDKEKTRIDILFF